MNILCLFHVFMYGYVTYSAQRFHGGGSYPSAKDTVSILYLADWIADKIQNKLRSDRHINMRLSAFFKISLENIGIKWQHQSITSNNK